ncbi:hypothetical protein DF185_08360 [Marinifilum breve]|uniref:Uncharacterized protein n=1 Tax=Marinifilum breve TaxID=2184082 RepID=A0A2V4A0W3_9BACT|nr:hypothetical protein DF185_08360 [Marinifilum breve]
MYTYLLVNVQNNSPFAKNFKLDWGEVIRNSISAPIVRQTLVFTSFLLNPNYSLFAFEKHELVGMFSILLL